MCPCENTYMYASRVCTFMDFTLRSMFSTICVDPGRILTCLYIYIWTVLFSQGTSRPSWVIWRIWRWCFFMRTNWKVSTVVRTFFFFTLNEDRCAIRCLSVSISLICWCLFSLAHKWLFAVLAAMNIPSNVLILIRALHHGCQTIVCIGGVVVCESCIMSDIKQGCPLSIVFKAFLMRPWVLQVRSMKAYPRVLADDILVSISGKQANERFVPIFDATVRR